MTYIAIATTDSDVENCFFAMQELRPALERKDFLRTIRRLEAQGYKLVSLTDVGKVRAVSGFRICDNMAFGRYLYIEDLVTLAEDRRRGYGEAIFNWLIEQSKLHCCEQIHLDSGVQRFDTHRFYMRRGMGITSHHFAMRVPS
jgi:GNAT superfamily N-acetyltransferase